MAEVTWLMKAYNAVSGAPIPIQGLNPNLAPSETIYNAFNRSLTYNLNGIDELNFSMLLTDPMAAALVPLESTVSLWRTIDDEVAGKTYSQDDPDFSGLVTYTNKSGSDNTMTVKVSSPLWRLQTHFHLLNHYLNVNPDTSDLYTMSELMWKLIDLINNAFGGLTSYTGIDLGTFSWGFPFEPSLVPAFIAKGTNTYQYIFNTIMSGTTTGVDIIPEYKHTDNNPTLMLFSTAGHRGNFDGITGNTSFIYHYTEQQLIDEFGDPPPINNCDDMVEEIAPVPSTSSQDGGFANYLWTIGQGGANSGKVAVAENTDPTDQWSVQNIGVFMATVQDDSWRTYAQAAAAAPLELAVKKIPQINYTVSLAPGGRTYYGIDYTLGDVIPLYANKGVLILTDTQQRIFQATLNMSDNNIERAVLSVSDDYNDQINNGNNF